MGFVSASWSERLLRIGVALSFLYPPINAWFDPYSWIGYFPSFVTDMIAPHGILVLHAFGIVEIVIALWILFGRNVRIPSYLAALMLLAIVFFNASQFTVLFRDVAIALMAIALALYPRSHA